MNKKIALSIPEDLYNKLCGDKEKYSYNNVQDIILDALRERYYSASAQKTENSKTKKAKLKQIPLKETIIKPAFCDED